MREFGERIIDFTILCKQQLLFGLWEKKNYKQSSNLTTFVRQMRDAKNNCISNNFKHSTSKYCYFDVADLSAKPIKTR